MWSCFSLFHKYLISLHNSMIEPIAPGNKALSSLLGNSKNQIRKTVLGINKHMIRPLAPWRVSRTPA